MYKEIDDLIKAITEDEIFKEFCKADQLLHDEKTLALLSRHQIAQEDYMRLKAYQNSDVLVSLKENLKAINKEISNHPQIMNYYQKYYALNELLESVTKIVFADISDDISLERFVL
jgi:cell fate (sporulation/competence/biofilm development) regulator YlbF (YheA/YmcA/DUF963 family)